MSRLRYRADTREYARVVNLSDGVFAIALTLLVLTLDAPDVPAARLAATLLEEIPQVIVFALSFALVANIWWFHHKIVSQLAELDVVTIALNFVMLGLVALIPFPTSLVGNAPTERAAVLPFIGVFLAIAIVCLLMVLWVARVGAWRRTPEPEQFRWLVGGWLGDIAGMLIAMAVALWIPIAGLVVSALVGVTVGLLLGIFGPSGYRDWVERPGF